MSTIVTVTTAVQLRRNSTEPVESEKRKVFTPGQYVDETLWILPDEYRRVISDSAAVGDEPAPTAPLPPPSSVGPMDEGVEEIVVEPMAGGSFGGPLAINVHDSTIADIETALLQLPEEDRDRAARWVAEEETTRPAGIRPTLLSTMNQLTS